MTMRDTLSQERKKELRSTMLKMKIYEKDIKESFIRSSGPGGQNVNKVATCVVLLHLPTKLQVKSQQERSQGLNRYVARCRLIAKIEKLRKKEEQKIVYEQQKKKRQERKRSKSAKENILEDKKQLSRKKKTRQGIKPHKLDDFV